MTTHRDWTFGNHSARFEPPDTLTVRLQGPVGFEEARKLVSLSRELGSERPFYLLVDMSRATTVDPEARAHASVNLKSEWYAGVAYVGANFVMKAAARGVAMLLFLLGRPTFDIAFVATEAEGLEALARMRALREASAA